MRNRFEIGAYELLLVGCAAALAVLVYAEGWIWPLKAAAFMIPVTLLIGSVLLCGSLFGTTMFCLEGRGLGRAPVNGTGNFR